jgi:transposase-like protein
MGFRIPTPPHIRAAILEDVQKNGMSIADAAKKHNITSKTIHNWLRTTSKGTSVSWSDFHRIRSENQLLKQIVGELTLSQSRTKKM